VESRTELLFKNLAWFHRWVGVGLCLMFATWFATGAVMVFVAFPALSDRDRAAQSEPIDLARLRIAPAQAQALLGGGDLRLVSLGGAPAYVGSGHDGKAVAISGETGYPLRRLQPAAARRIAARFEKVTPVGVGGPFDYDQWIVHQQFDPLRPFYRVDLADRQHTQLYVSARTGEVVQRTRGYERAWNWLGSVIHWIYFVPIRKSFALWDWTVWGLALVGLSTAAVGIWLGVTRTNKKLNSKRPAISPFRGLMRWHHLLGLVAGVFVVCWITSGWLSMDHGRLFSEGTAGEAAARAYREGASSASPISLTVAELQRLGPASDIEFQRVAGRDVAAARGAAGPRVLVTSGGELTVRRAVPAALIAEAVKAAWPRAEIRSVAPVVPGSAYAKAESLTSDAILVRVAGPAPSRLYIDGVSGKLLVVMGRSRQAYAWFYYMLHTYNFPGLTSRPVLRITLLMIPLSLGFAFSITGVLVGVRRLRLAAAR
jgi:hypothetical protein